MRPSFRDVYMRTALDLAKRSTCRRLQVGCVIVTPDFRQVLSVGYNGNAHGLPNDCDSPEPGRCGCLHAEENAIIKCEPDRPKVVLCTHLPCVMCAKRLVQLGGVVSVFYANDYRIRDSEEIFKSRSIPCHQHQFTDDRLGSMRPSGTGEAMAEALAVDRPRPTPAEVYKAAHPASRLPPAQLTPVGGSMLDMGIKKRT